MQGHFLTLRCPPRAGLEGFFGGCGHPSRPGVAGRLRMRVELRGEY